MEDGIRFPRGEGLAMHSIVQMVLLVVMVETRIDTVHTHREDAEVEMIRE